MWQMDTNIKERPKKLCRQLGNEKGLTRDKLESTNLVKRGRIVVNVLKNDLDTGSGRLRIEAPVLSLDNQVVDRDLLVVQLVLDHDDSTRFVDVKLVVLKTGNRDLNFSKLILRWLTSV